MTHTGHINEDQADIRLFVNKLERGWKEYKDRKDIYILFNVKSIFDVDLPKQQCHAIFKYYVSWEEDVKKIDIGDEDEIWNKNVFSKGFDPQICLTNCIKWNENETKEWFHVVSMDRDNHCYKYCEFKEFKELKKAMRRGGGVVVIKTTLSQGWFEEAFEIADYPVDVQHFYIGVTSHWDHENVAISYSRFQRSIIPSDALASQTYIMCEPRLFSYRDDWETHSQPLFNSKI